MTAEIFLILLGFFVLYITVRGLQKSVVSDFQKLGESIAQLAEQISGIREKVDAVEWLEISEEQKSDRVFDQTEHLTLSEVRSFKQGSVLELVSRSVYYPDHVQVFDRFDYRHEYVDESSETKYGYEVHGSAKREAEAEWTPYSFLVNEKEARTSSCAGTIKRCRFDW